MQDGLSKSRLLDFQQCPKRLWLGKHRPELADDSGSERVFKTGHQVGDLARQLYGGGTLISRDDQQLDFALQRTSELMKSQSGFPLYEATFQHDGLLVKADVVTLKRGALNLLEVKSSTQVKEQYVDDCSIQFWVMKHAGHRPNRVSVVHLDNAFVYPGDGRYEGIFKEVDITQEALRVSRKVPGLLRDARSTLRGPEPKQDIGPHCSTPYDCPFYSHCEGRRTKYPVTILPHGGKKMWALRAEGLRDVRDVPEDRLSPRQVRVRSASRSGQPIIDDQLAPFLRALPYPRYYLDFETLNPGIPLWLGTRPYEQVPFQWSCHREDRGGSLKHSEFLADGTAMPAREFAESLLRAIGDKGPVLVYSGFEGSVLSALAKRFKDLAGDLEGIRSRLVDLLKPMQTHYYHPAMMGSWSIKAVLPTLAPELSYELLGSVKDGGAAQAAYEETLLSTCTAERRQALRKDLLAYCKLDTNAMVTIVRRLSS